MSTEIEVVDVDLFKAGMTDVRSDASPINWSLFGHPDGNPNLLCFQGSGSGGLEEMCDGLMDSEMQYALVRLQETIDMSPTIKFVFIRWSGCNVPFVRKGKYGVVQGSVEKEFTTYHTSIDTDSKDELSEEYVMTKLQEQSGTRSKVLEATVAKTRPERGFTSGTTTKMDSTGTTPTQSAHMGKIGKMGSSYTGMTGMAKSSGGMRTSPEVDKYIKDVRDDHSQTCWCTVGYEDEDPKKELIALKCGEDVADFPEEFNNSNDVVRYGLVRVKDQVDDIPTVKFAYIQWVGDDVKPMKKAKSSTHKGALENRFKPFHVSIFATSASEVSTRIINDKVTSASGSKSNVKS